jgi:hypothetical protein
MVLFWVALIHTSGMPGVFVLDDQFALVENRSLLDFWNLQWFRWTGRPVTMATFAASFTLFGPAPFSCHVVNLAIHVAAVSVLYALVARSLTLLWPRLDSWRRLSIAASAALLWGVHPICTAAVTYLVQRAESLASLFILAAVLAWSKAFGDDVNTTADAPAPSRNKRVLWAFCSVTLASLAYGSKEMAAGLPLIILLFDRVVVAQSWRPLLSRTHWYAALVLPLVVGAAMILPGLTEASAGRSTVGFNVEGFSSWAYFTSQPRVLLEYLRLAVLPFGQSLDYGWLPPRDPTTQWLGLAAWIGLAASLIWLWRNARPLALLMLTALFVLAPTSTFLPLQDIIFEHRFYLPLACLVAAVLGWIGTRDRGAEGAQTVGRWRLLAGAALLAVPLSLLTIVRNSDYWSRARIHAVDVQRHPGNPRAWYALALSVKLDRPEPKIEMLRKATELSEERGFYYAGSAYALPRDLADTLFHAGRVSQSRAYYEMALPRSNSQVQRTHVLFQLAMIASIEGRIDDAERLFQETLAADAGIREQVKIVYAAHRERIGRAKSPSGVPAQIRSGSSKGN